MQCRLAEVRQPRGIEPNLFTQSFEAAAAEVREVGPVRVPRGAFIQVDRNVQLTPYALRQLLRQDHAIAHGDARKRNQRHNVGSADTRMNTGMPV
jgi:hypothetical protein